MSGPLLELVFRALCDERPAPPAEAAYLFCQTSDNQASVFAAARTIAGQGLARRILICDGPPLSGYPGAAAWQQELVDLGLDEGIVGRVPMPAPLAMLHTLIEATALVSFARTQGHGKILVVSSPFHQPRAFMTTISVASKTFPELKIYSYPGLALPWHADAVHSQGTLQARRTDLIAAEMQRIETYQAKGDLASFEEVRRYLVGRDGYQAS